MSHASAPPSSLGEPIRCVDCGAEFMWHHGEGECVRRQFGALFEALRADVAALEARVGRLEDLAARSADDGK